MFTSFVLAAVLVAVASATHTITLRNHCPYGVEPIVRNYLNLARQHCFKYFSRAELRRRCPRWMERQVLLVWCDVFGSLIEQVAFVPIALGTLRVAMAAAKEYNVCLQAQKPTRVQRRDGQGRYEAELDRDAGSQSALA
ncbi:hypothetical protein C8J57DRAFT_1213422 [Mycena rebaudengoi]|nr:hypothetical protein C8J57DRAFT_1213422 [Mycena rebaudengoi]